MSNAQKLMDKGIRLNKNTGQTKTLCPKCSHTRKAANRKEPCLSVNIDEGIYNCHNCGWNGGVDAKEYATPEWVHEEQVGEYALIDYMIKERGISKDTLNKYEVKIGHTFIPKEGAEVEAIMFPYFRRGNIVNIKYRSENKGFKMVSNAELILYNLDAIPHDVDAIDTVVITEGEIDALSFIEAGIENVVSVPNGASKGNNNLQYIDNTAIELEKVDKFYLALDKDDNGEKLVQELSRRLGKDKCFIIDFPEGYKDANQVLTKLGKEELRNAYNKARPMPIEGVVRANECKDSMLHLYRNGIDRGDQVGLNKFDTLVSFKTSMLYVITGIPTHGKTSFLNLLEVRLAVKCMWKWAIFSPENYPLDYLIYRYAEILVGKGFFNNANHRMTEYEMTLALEFVHEHFYFIRPNDGMYTMSELLDVAKSLVLRHGVRGFTIDPWNTIKHDYTTGMSETQYIETALNELTIFKQTHDIAVFLVAHPRKMNKIKDQNHAMYGLHEVPTLYDISGSKSFYDKADVGITVYRNFNTNITTAYVQKVKFKHLGEVGMQEFKYLPDNSRYAECSPQVDIDGGTVPRLDNAEDETPYSLIELPDAQQVIEADWTEGIEQNNEFLGQPSDNDDDDLPF